MIFNSSVGILYECSGMCCISNCGSVFDVFQFKSSVDDSFYFYLMYLEVFCSGGCVGCMINKLDVGMFMFMVKFLQGGSQFGLYICLCFYVFGFFLYFLSWFLSIRDFEYMCFGKYYLIVSLILLYIEWEDLLFIFEFMLVGCLDIG